MARSFLQGKPESTRLPHIFIKALELSLAPALAFLFSWIIERKWVKAIVAYLLLHAGVELLSGIFGFVYYVDADNYYHHGDFYWIYVMSYMLSILFGIYIVARNVKRYQYSGISFFLLVVAFMITGIVIQLCSSTLKVVYITIGISSAMLYVFTLEMIQQTDELTELLNRRGYENYIAHMGKKCLIIFFDVDGFKMINDTYGHAFGDAALKGIAGAIKKHYARYGRCFRYGGDEFCVILTTRLDNIKELNHDFFDTMAELRKGEEKMPSVSIGYAYYDPDNQNIQDAADEADRMMYKFKAARKARSLKAVMV